MGRGQKRYSRCNLLQDTAKDKKLLRAFCRGGALFFKIYNRVDNSCISDLNIDLVVAYSVIKNDVTKLIEQLKIHAANHNKDYYYQLRNQQALDDPVANSARFIYLMQTCYNGLFRVNKHNEFNTPIGNYKNPTICNEENLLAASKVLKTTSIKYQDFSKITPQKGDFVYFDPPYHNSFAQYINDGFSNAEQIRLRNFALKLTKEGVNVMLSNSDNDFIAGLYSNKHFNIEKIIAPRSLSCRAEKRQPVFEILITNY